MTSAHCYAIQNVDVLLVSLHQLPLEHTRLPEVYDLGEVVCQVIHTLLSLFRLDDRVVSVLERVLDASEFLDDLGDVVVGEDGGAGG